MMRDSGSGRRPDVPTPVAAERSEGRETSDPVDGEENDITTPVDATRAPNNSSIRPDLGPPAPGPQSAHQPGSGLGLVISFAISAVVVVLAIYVSGSATSNPLPLAQTTNALFWIVATIATVAAGVGAYYADRTASRAKESMTGPEPGIGTAWIVPVVATAAAIVLVATFHNPMMIIAGAVIAFLGNAGALLSRDLLDDADDSAQRSAATVHALVVHSVAFLALSAIYLNKLPTFLTALLAGGVAVLLAIEAFDRLRAPSGRKHVFALLTGGAVAAAVPPLMWWLTHGWTGGAVLFIVFYCGVGVTQVALERGSFRARDALEYGLAPLAAFLLLAVTA